MTTHCTTCLCNLIWCADSDSVLLNIACMGTTGVPVFTSNCVFPNAACIALGCGESFGVPLTVSNKFQEHSAVAAWLCAIPCDHVVYERQYATETAVRARSVFVSHAHKRIHLSYGLLPREIQCLYRKHKNRAANVPVPGQRRASAHQAEGEMRFSHLVAQLPLLSWVNTPGLQDGHAENASRAYY